MNTEAFVKPYAQPRRAAAARAHHAWLRSLEAGIRLPELLAAGKDQLVFERLSGRHPGPGDLPTVADALGRLHAVAHTRHLHAAQLDAPLATADGLVIADFAGPRRAALAGLNLPLEGLAVALYKDANIRNFLLTDAGVAIVDFDDLTLAPFGYDLAKLIVSTAMTHGPLARDDVERALGAYNARTQPAGGAPTTCSFRDLGTYAEVHHSLTAPYLGRNGYRHAWPEVRPWPQPGQDR